MATEDGGLAERLGRLVALNEAERVALVAVAAEARGVARGALLQREREHGGGPWLLRAGWAASALSMPDGGRQITQIHLPSDLIGLTSLGLARAGETIQALTELSVATVSPDALGRLFERHPRLGALLLLDGQAERHRLSERLATIGRTDARTRLACLLLDLIDRLGVAGGDGPARMPLPLTQEEIGDTLGLTAVHVNRMMRALTEEGLIAREGGGWISLRDPARLRRFAGCGERARTGELGWLPAARTE